MIRKIASPGLVLTFAVGLTMGAVRADAPAPVRHLVYSYTYTSTQKQTLHSSGISSGTDNGGEMGTPSAAVQGSTESTTGSVDYSAALNDKGTITVDVMAVQPDNGISVNVSEASTNSRQADVAACVVYGTTFVLCDPNAKVNPEEYAVLRLLGRGFINPALIDSKNHWRQATSSSQQSETEDFTIDKTDGNIANITSLTVTKQIGPQGFTATANGTIVYDKARSVPTQIVEDQTIREQQSADSYSETRIQTAFTLTTDSLATAATAGQ